MDRVINFNILSNPANWVIIFLVLYLVALIVSVLFKAASQGAPLPLPQGL